MGDICPNCKRDLKGQVKFCGYCGASIKDTTPKTYPKAKPTKSSKQQPLFQPYYCAQCNQPKKFVQTYNSWYCNTCKKYDTKTINYPKGASLYCAICGDPIKYIDQYSKWYCKTCRDYTLDMEQFYLDPNEKIQKSFSNCQYNTSKYSKKITASSSWQDTGTLTITDKSIIFGGKIFWLKTNEIKNITKEISNYSNQGAEQWICVRIDYQDPYSGFDNVAYLRGGGGMNAMEVFNKTGEVFDYLTDWWDSKQKPKTPRKPPKEVEEVKWEEPPIETSVETSTETVVETPITTSEETPIDTSGEDGMDVISDSSGIKVLSGVNYEHANIIFKVKVENNSTKSISAVNIIPYVPKDIFSLDEIEKVIPLIRKGEAITSTFTIRPKGECGNVKISGDVKYYDTQKEEYNTLKIKPRQTKIICPMLKIIPIKDDQWRGLVSNLISVKEKTEDIPLGAEELFDIVSDVLKDMNMYMLKPKIRQNSFIGRFYSEGIKGFKYAVKVEILGGPKKSKLLLNAYAENEECLIGCYHKVLDEIEDRTDIKQYLKDTGEGKQVLEEKIIIEGDYIVGGRKVNVQDSVVQRSSISTGEDGEDGEGEVNIKDSVVQRSKIRAGKDDEEDTEIDWEE